MNDWTSGYVAEIGYTYGYYPELNPLRAKWIALLRGVAVSQGLGTSAGVSCELGFGQGVSVNIHSAATGSQWWGTDFNPSQAAFAKGLADSPEAASRLFDLSFEEFAKLDLPEFDFIGFHGIWSWISDSNRKIITDFVRAKLKVGGVVYLSYNTQPGWSASMPLRHLFTEHALRLASPGSGIVNRVDGALAFVDKLIATQPKYLLANPQIPDRIARIKEHERAYLAHEYFNRDWHPMHFAQTAEVLGEAKLGFLGSAAYLELVDGLNLSEAQRGLLSDVADPIFQETVKDFCFNQQFRRDLWCKGGRRLSSIAQVEAIRSARFILVQLRKLVPNKVSGYLGEADLQPALYGPVLDFLADNRPHSFEEIERHVAEHKITHLQLREILTVLLGANALAPAQSDEAAESARAQCERINTKLLIAARADGGISYLASPVLGGGVAVTRFHQLFLLARQLGYKGAHEWANWAHGVLQSQKQNILKEGRALETPEENLAELQNQAHGFAAVQLPILINLGVAKD